MAIYPRARHRQAFWPLDLLSLPRHIHHIPRKMLGRIRLLPRFDDPSHSSSPTCFHFCWSTLPSTPSTKASLRLCSFPSIHRLLPSSDPFTPSTASSTKSVFLSRARLPHSSAYTTCICRLYFKSPTWFCLLFTPSTISSRLFTSFLSLSFGRVCSAGESMSTLLLRSWRMSLPRIANSAWVLPRSAIAVAFVWLASSVWPWRYGCAIGRSTMAVIGAGASRSADWRA